MAIPGNPRSLHTGRAAGVIKLVTEKAGWGSEMPKGRALGLAFHLQPRGPLRRSRGRERRGNKKIKVHKIWVAADIGPIVNMSGAENQCQGSVIDGLSTAMGLAITFESGKRRAEQLRQVSDHPDRQGAGGRGAFHPVGLLADRLRRARVPAGRARDRECDLHGERPARTDAAVPGGGLHDLARGALRDVNRPGRDRGPAFFCALDSRLIEADSAPVICLSLLAETNDVRDVPELHGEVIDHVVDR